MSNKPDQIDRILKERDALRAGCKLLLQWWDCLPNEGQLPDHFTELLTAIRAIRAALDE